MRISWQPDLNYFRERKLSVIRLFVECKTCGTAFFSGIAVASMEVARKSTFSDVSHQCPNGHKRRYTKPDYFPNGVPRE